MILVTGGTGMLGAHLLHNLLLKNIQIRALKRKNSNLEIVKQIFQYYSNNAEELFEKIEWFDADMMDKYAVFESMHGIETVYHSAALVSFNPKDRRKMLENNVHGTANIVNAAIENKVSKFCHVSSISALGISESEGLVDEKTFRNPKGVYSGYSLSKYYSELEVWRGITEGLNAVIVNPSIILGPGNWNSGSPSIFSAIKKGMRFYSKGITGYVDVLDVVKAMTTLVESDITNERFIVSSENLSYKEIFTAVANNLNVKKPNIPANSFMLSMAWRIELLRNFITGKTPLITKEIANSAQNHHLYSSEKLINSLGFKFNPIAQCILRIAEIYKKEHELKKNIQPI